MPAANRNHGIDRLQAGLHRLLDGFAINHARSDALHRVVLRGLDRTLAVDRVPERVHHTAQHLVPDRNRDDSTGATDLVAFLERRVVTQQNGAHLILFEVHGDTGNVPGELDQLAGHHALQAVEPGDAVAERDHGSNFRDLQGGIVILDPVTDQLRNL